VLPINVVMREPMSGMSKVYVLTRISLGNSVCFWLTIAQLISISIFMN